MRFIARVFTLLSVVAAMAVMTSCSKTEYDTDAELHGIVSVSGSGEPVNGATISLSPGGRTTVSGSDGQYQFDALDPGQYTITVQKDGYATNRKNVKAVSGESVRADITLSAHE